MSAFTIIGWSFAVALALAVTWCVAWGLGVWHGHSIAKSEAEVFGARMENIYRSLRQETDQRGQIIAKLERRLRKQGTIIRDLRKAKP